MKAILYSIAIFTTICLFIYWIKATMYLIKSLKK
jgi:hypothetical protein